MNLDGDNIMKAGWICWLIDGSSDPCHGWIDGWIGGCIDGWMHQWMDGSMNRWMEISCCKNAVEVVLTPKLLW